MSDHERGAYTPPTDAPLSFDARQPVRGTRPIPFTLIIAGLVLAALAAAIVVFYRSGVREAGQPPQTVGAPVAEMKSAAPAEAQPQDPAAGLQIYRSEAGQEPEAVQAPQFAPPPEQPQARPTPAPVVIAAPAAAPTQPVAASPSLRPALPAAQAPAAKAPPAPAPKAPAPAPKAAAVAPAPAPAPAAAGGAVVQIGAVSSTALADKAWNEAMAIAPAAGKGKSVQKIDKDGSTLYRTAVTGFASKAEAAAFCARLKAAGKSCFVR
jgi:hypothetical protein